MTETEFDNDKVRKIIQVAFKEIKKQEETGCTKDTAINNIIKKMKEILEDENRQYHFG